MTQCRKTFPENEAKNSIKHDHLQTHRAPVFQRRQARNAFYRNAWLWGIGNGLLGSMLIQYFIYDLCDTHPNVIRNLGLTVAWVIAAPRLAGFFRLLAPSLIDACGSRKWFCIVGLLIAPLIVIIIPVMVPILMRWESLSHAIVLIVVLWCVYHLVEYLAMAAFWSWLADLVSLKIRGRFLAVRERWLLLGQVAGAIATTLFIDNYPRFAKIWGTADFANEKIPAWEKYLFPAILGSIALLISALPLTRIPEIAWHKTVFRCSTRLRQAFIPILHGRFMLFVAFGCWVQMANGLTQATQSAYHKLLFPGNFLLILVLMNGSRIGQFLISPAVGRWVDRFRTVPVMIISMLIAAVGSLFYFLATPESRYWIIGAWVFWIAWVGVNIGINELSLSLAPPEEKTAYIAFYYAVTTAALAITTLLGGMLADTFRRTIFDIPLINTVWDYPQLSFVMSWFLRTLGIFWLLFLMMLDSSRKNARNKN